MTPFEKTDISVYIHIPFCIKRRPGEDTLLVPSNREVRNSYMDALDRELMSAGDQLDGRQIASITVGGGIATTVSPDKLSRMMLKFRRTYNVKPRAEFSISAGPQTLVVPCLSSLNSCNVNRISIEALSPVDALLEKIEAPHRLVDIENGSALVVKFGHTDIDVLLLYGIPGQTCTTIKNTIQAFTSVKGFRHLTLKKYELAEQSGMTQADLEDLYRTAVEVCAERGMSQYAAGRFACEGAESSFVLHEYLGMERIGFGLGARSYLDHMVYQNTTDFDTYLQYSDDYTKIITAARELDELDQMKHFLALRLQLKNGFSDKEYQQEFNCRPDGAIKTMLEELHAAEFAARTDDRIVPTERGLMYPGEIITRVLGK